MAGRPRRTSLPATRAAWIRQAYLEYHAGRLTPAALRAALTQARRAKPPT